MKKPKGTKRLQPKSKSPGSTPHGTHNPGANLGKYLHKAKLPTGKKIGVKSVVKSIKQSKGRIVNVD